MKEIKYIHVAYDQEGIIFLGGIDMASFLTALAQEDGDVLAESFIATIVNPEKNFFNKHIKEFQLYIP